MREYTKFTFLNIEIRFQPPSVMHKHILHNPLQKQSSIDVKSIKIINLEIKHKLNIEIRFQPFPGVDQTTH